MNTTAQRIVEERTGNFRAQGNIAPGYLFGQKQVTAYVTGDMDLYIAPNVSLFGSIWYSIPIGKSETGIKANHAVFGGVNYHFLKKGRWDPYIGLTPGAGLVSVAYRDGEIIKHSNYNVAPLVSGIVGFNYYVGSFFHFFARVQGVAGQYFGDLPTPKRLDELKLAAGMGWNVGFWKPKKKTNSRWVE